MLVATVLETDGVTLAGGTEQPGSEFIGHDVAVLAGAEAASVSVGDDAVALFAASDTVIDFTAPAATVAHAALAADAGKALVVGTTGLSAADDAALAEAAKRSVILQAANFSIGVNLMLGLTEQVASLLDDDYDIEIVEMHHRHKVDAPSGTALAIGEAAAKGRGVALADVSQRVRDGITGPRRAGDIGFATLRGGDVTGEHSAIFAADGERIEISHKSSSRGLFAKGAMRAALWTAGRPPGFYSMRDVLGFN